MPTVSGHAMQFNRPPPLGISFPSHFDILSSPQLIRAVPSGSMPPDSPLGISLPSSPKYVEVCTPNRRPATPTPLIPSPTPNFHHQEVMFGSPIQLVPHTPVDNASAAASFHPISPAQSYLRVIPTRVQHPSHYSTANSNSNGGGSVFPMRWQIPMPASLSSIMSPSKGQRLSY